MINRFLLSFGGSLFVMNSLVFLAMHDQLKYHGHAQMIVAGIGGGLVVGAWFARQKPRA